MNERWIVNHRCWLSSFALFFYYGGLCELQAKLNSIFLEKWLNVIVVRHCIFSRFFSSYLEQEDVSIIKHRVAIPSRKGNHVRNTSDALFNSACKRVGRWSPSSFIDSEKEAGFSRPLSTGWTSVSSRVTQSKTPVDNLYEKDATIRDNAISWFAVFRAPFELRIFFVHAPR